MLPATTEHLSLAAAMRRAALPAAQVRDADLPESPAVHRVDGRIVLDPDTPTAVLGTAGP